MQLSLSYPILDLQGEGSEVGFLVGDGVGFLVGDLDGYWNQRESDSKRMR